MRESVRNPGVNSGSINPQPVSLAGELRKLAAQITQDLQGDGFFKPMNASYVLGRIEGRLISALLAQHAVADPQVCEKTMHMYVWTRQPRFVAVAQAENVERAREILLEEIETSRDGSCPEREAADKWVRENNPSIWHQRNAEFALTDSAELREQEDYSNKLQKQVEELKAAAHAAEQPKLTSVWTITEEAAKHSHFCYHKDSDEWKCSCGEVLSKYVMPYDERRKLNSLDREMAFVRFNHKDHFRFVLHGLLTSPVAPPPQQKENDDATKMR